jgi:hypothetical protein
METPDDDGFEVFAPFPIFCEWDGTINFTRQNAPLKKIYSSRNILHPSIRRKRFREIDEHTLRRSCCHHNHNIFQVRR